RVTLLDVADDALFACAALAGDQDVRVGARDAIDFLAKIFDWRARTNQLGSSVKSHTWFRLSEMLRSHFAAPNHPGVSGRPTRVEAGITAEVQSCRHVSRTCSSAAAVAVRAGEMRGFRRRYAGFHGVRGAVKSLPRAPIRRELADKSLLNPGL